ncbi:MAG TPA: class I SAM-dependent methyltransferase [Mycobacteriales bacterium]|jgi:SAM-dependent methyltransferase|nr:class I SAM-dependent methyltransferase [Mycobacteriales bacterium]
MTGPSVREQARTLSEGMTVDEARDVVRWPGGEVGLHDYAALYAVPGLYEAVYVHVLGSGSPALLGAALAEVVPEPERAARRVLDVGAGTGMVGEVLAGLGFRGVAGVDLEPAAEVALRRDRPTVYGRARTLDLTALSPADSAWLADVAPDVVTTAGAVGFGHLPVEAFEVLTWLLPPGGLCALTVARGFEQAPELAAFARLLLGPGYDVLVRRDGVHRRSAVGELLVTALVLSRTSS